MGSIVKERGGFKLYECYIDGTFAKAKGGGDGIGCTKAGKGVKMMIMVDARGLPTRSIRAAPARMRAPWSRLSSTSWPVWTFKEKLIGDKAYDSDRLDEKLAEMGVEMISPHRS